MIALLIFAALIIITLAMFFFAPELVPCDICDSWVRKEEAIKDNGGVYCKWCHEKTKIKNAGPEVQDERD
jgi:hypothetical protein